MDRKFLKSQAKDLIRTSDPKPVYMAIIYLVIIAVLGFLSYKIVGGSTEAISSQFTNDFRFSINEYGEYAPSVDPEQYYYALQEAMPTPAESLLNIAISLVTTVLGAGFTIFVLRTLSGSGASYWNIFDGFGMFFRIIWLYILEGVFIFLWALLLIFPAFIAYYRYRMAIYLLLEHPEMSALECISESKRLMAGHKWELFVLDLSFIGWAVLVGIANFISSELAIPVVSVIGFGILVQIYFLPYYELTCAGYYRQLTAPVDPDPFNGWTPNL